MAAFRSIGLAALTLFCALAPAGVRAEPPGSGAATGPAPILKASSPNRLVYLLAGHRAKIFAAAFSPDGRLVASGDEEGTLKLWELAGGVEVRSIAAHAGPINSVIFADDSQIALTAGADGDVKSWNTATGEPAGSIPSGLFVKALANLPGGRILAAGCAASDTKPTLCKQPLMKILDRSATAAPITLEADRAVHPWGIVSIAATRDARFAYSCGSHIQIWDLENSGKLSSVFKEGLSCWAIHLSQDGRHAIVGGALGDLELFSADAPVGGAWKRFKTDRVNILAAAIAPGGRLVLSGSGDNVRLGLGNFGKVILWDASSGEAIRTLEEDKDFVRVVAFSPDGRLGLSAGFEKAVKIWDVSEWSDPQAASPR